MSIIQVPMSLDSTSTHIARQLLAIEAIKLRPEAPFRWSSGWMSPIYCDNRMTLSFPVLRTAIKDGLVALIRTHYPQVQAIAGVATAGIPQGALVAEAMELPFLYVRPKPKDHGMENLIEGRLTPGQKIVVVEDLISTGGSALKAVDALREAGAEVVGMVAIFTYGFELSDKNFKEKNVSLHTLSDYHTLIEYCVAQNTFSADTIKSLQEWRANPEIWGK